MANEIFKELKTRIALKTLDIAGWEAIKETYKPLKGEVCVCEIPTGNNVPTANSVTPPTVLFKVGDGVNFWKDLNWASALAADVYSWAKQANLPVERADEKNADGTDKVAGNVISSIYWENDKIKYTTASVATSEGLEGLQEAVEAIEKDIADNRDTWVLDTDTRYSFSTDGDKLVVKKTLYTNGVAGIEEAVGTYEFLTAEEIAKTLEGYYTKADLEDKIHTEEEIKAMEIAHATAAGKVDTAITVKVGGADVVFDGHEAKTADVDAAIAAAEQRAKDYADAKPHENTAHTHSVGDGLVKTGDGGISGDVKYELNLAFGELTADNKLQLLDATNNAVIAEFDAAAFVKDSFLEGASYDEETNDLTLTFIDNSDNKQDIVIPLDDLVDIYAADETSITLTVSGDGKVFKVKDGGIETKHIKDGNVTETKLEKNVTDALALARTALQSHQSLEHLATKEALEDVVDGTTPVAKATDADKLDNHDSTYFATAESVTNITKENGTIDSKIAAYDASKNFGDIITHNFAEFATSEQGGKARTALQEIEVGTGLTVSDKSENKQTIEIDTNVVFVLNCNW